MDRCAEVFQRCVSPEHNGKPWGRRPLLVRVDLGFGYPASRRFIGVIDLRRRRISGSASSGGEELRGLLRDLGLKAGDSYVETGSYILRPFQGHGYGTQARRAALTVAFTYCGFGIAVSESWPTNAASQAVSLSCGYTFLGTNHVGSNGASAVAEESDADGSDVGNNNVGNENEKVRMYCTPDIFNCGSTLVHVDGWTPELATMLGIQTQRG